MAKLSFLMYFWLFSYKKYRNIDKFASIHSKPSTNGKFRALSCLRFTIELGIPKIFDCYNKKRSRHEWNGILLFA